MGSNKKNSNKYKTVFHAAEVMSHDLSLLRGKKNPNYFDDSDVLGLLSVAEIETVVQQLKKVDVDSYIRRVVSPSESKKRPSAPEVIKQLGGKMIAEEMDGPLYSAELEFLISGQKRRLGFIAQNHKNQNGVWSPNHHRLAAEKVRFFASHSIPMVTFMDTPGAAADAEANLDNQSHSISFLISEMANLQLPVVGIVFGGGYSGGAIPLATANILLSVREGVFNTIHPKGLSNIARKYDLSWQESAKHIGVSAYELQSQGYFDGIIDYTYDQPHLVKNIKDAIVSAVEVIENNSCKFLNENDFFFDHYRDSINHFLNPSKLLIESNRVTDRSPTGTLNIFGDVYRFMRYLKLRQRIVSRTLDSYARLSSRKKTVGKLQERLKNERQEKFEHWLNTPLEVRYHEKMNKGFSLFTSAREDREKERARLVAFFIGDPRENYAKALDDLTLEIMLYLYNYWKDSASENMIELHEYLDKATLHDLPPRNPNLLDLLKTSEINQSFQNNFKNILIFDLLYNQVIEALPTIADELKGSNQISQKSVEQLFEQTVEGAMQEFEKNSLKLDSKSVRTKFFKWLASFIDRKDCDDVLGTISEWKRVVFPRMSPPLFGVVRYYFSGLLPSLYAAQQNKGRFQGKITPRNIGIKDFWNRLDQSYKDLLIQNLLREYKSKVITTSKVIEYYFKDFKELYADRITSNPVKFPGFRDAIEQALTNGVTPCGVVTGLATFTSLENGTSGNGNKSKNKQQETAYRVGLIVSNVEFQAGSFDMASCEKVCRLMDDCARLKIPVIFFISSGGMQTKEGGGSLFSMAIINERITRFVKDLDLPVMCFGFRDCTGGAQASFMTHLLARTYYFSGAQIPFAGQLVVESHLPAHSTLSNYLSANPGTMDGLVKNPFDADVDEKLQQIDPQITTAKYSVEEIISRVLSGEYQLSVADETRLDSIQEDLHLGKLRRVLIHARGCTAARLIRGSQDAGLEVVLVASDPDIESYPASLLREKDRLVCIGGNTPQDSYLNGMSVIRVAEQEEVDAIHPGIGFLSESPHYARICREHGFNFVGPRVANMDRMGNKSNAIATAKNLKIPVVPGSEGALMDPEHAMGVASEIGFPVLIKAAHGGGGKGIEVVREAKRFKSTFARMFQEALSAFGNGDLYLEKFIGSMRHLEVQIIRDVHGNSKLLGIRDCSVQRNYQKLIEETASGIPSSIREKVYSYAEKLIHEIDYIGAGTVEFIYDLIEKEVYFMEMNTRLQVEHPVSEMVSGLDLVHMQYEVAQGNNIADVDFKLNGHAIELRIIAEKIELDDENELRFTPDPGHVTEVFFPEKANVRVIQTVTSDSIVSPFYDSLIAQIICWGKSRKETISRLSEYLERVKINGVSTNLALNRAILQDGSFQKGGFSTKYLVEFFERIDSKKLISESQKDSGTVKDSVDQQSIMLEDSEELKVLSPQMGGFYRATSPDDEPFVCEGQIIDVNHSLCLLESMKVFTELTLATFKNSVGDPLYPDDVNYKVTRVIAEDHNTVNKGDLLFVMQPVDV
ncbi:MAG: ATP-grasp domain-containing protein [SAR324 cluster bacterium]|nr:ATP-grasp domain-containing protein [SAR324 cluster bacterium]MBL7035904.1 ATP-grasp domain-containing protein [SAR324 cluster bacterium]